MQAFLQKPVGIGSMAVRRKSVNLALQGGGSHGAFTWGVLDRLLCEDNLKIEALSGTSAGAMNAVVVADGLTAGGPEAARIALDRFWEAVGKAATFSPLQRTPLERWLGTWSMDYSPGLMAMEMLGQVAGPYELNPGGGNPLDPILAESVDFERVRRCSAVKIFISATNVRTGRVKVFRQHEIDRPHVLASACLPTLFHAVEIDGETYWDGGYMGNPVLYPFYRSCTSDDIVLVQINPILRPDIPRTARQIQDRVNEITFNASLLREFRSINFVTRMLDEHRLDPTRYRQKFVHRIEAEADLNPLGASSKLNAELSFLQHLKKIGQDAAKAWLDANYKDIGERSTLDLRALFQGVESDDPEQCE